MKLWKRVKSALIERYNVRPKGEISLRLTGASPENPAEQLIKEILGESKSVSLSWVESQVRKKLYLTELRQGSWAVDIGLWGPAVFAEEAVRILSEVRPQFAYMVREKETYPAILIVNEVDDGKYK